MSNENETGGPGVCPKCGSCDVAMDDGQPIYEMVDEDREFSFTCEDCGTQFVEHFRFEFMDAKIKEGGKPEPEEREFVTWQDVVDRYNEAEHPIKVQYGNHDYGAVLDPQSLVNSTEGNVRLCVPAIHETMSFTQVDIIMSLNGVVLKKGGR